MEDLWEQSHVWGGKCQERKPSLGLASYTLSKFGESWTQSTFLAISSTPMPTTPTALSPKTSLVLVLPVQAPLGP